MSAKLRNEANCEPGNAAEPTEDPTQQTSANRESSAGGVMQLVAPQEYREKFATRLGVWRSTFSPADEYQSFYVQQSVVASMRVERSQVLEVNRLVELAEIAADPGPKWDQERKAEAARLGETLKCNPARVVKSLRQSPSGREWLLAQWQHLLIGVPAQARTVWSEVEITTALDLMGVAKTLRAAMISLQARLRDPLETRELILAEIAKLTAELADSSTENAKLRQLHQQGMAIETDPNLKQIRRVEAAAHRLLNQSQRHIDEFQKRTAKVAKSAPKTSETTPVVEPVVVAQPTPAAEPVTETKIVPPVVIKGNRRFRRKQQAVARHAAHHARRAA